jgi:DNA-binding NarL/FixJ family response regulator
MTTRTPPRSTRRAVAARGSRAPEARPRGPRTPAGPARIRIVVADHQAIDRAGLVGLLRTEEGFEIVGEAATVEDSVERCRTLAPDVLVLTLNLPARVREWAVATIRARLPGLRILALSERGAENCLVLNPPSRKWLAGIPLGTCPVGIDCLQLAARQGVMATLRRSAEPQDLVRAIHAVGRGQVSYDPTTAAGILEATAGDGGHAGARRLFSDREMQVAALLTEGQSNKEIAARLGIGEPTVKKHVGHILEKLGLQDRLQAGLFLARNPLLLNR